MLKRRAAIAAAVCALLWWSWTAAPGCAQATAAPDQAAADRFDLPESDVGIPGVGPIRREEWFRDAWAKRRAAFAERAEAEHGAVVFLGDSITQGWGDEFRGAFPEVKTANRGISGDTSRG
ncbi:MAG TPA: acetylhydrolase, partial [Lacipirellulaceae bacterium]|nr:acetylhydrolase [Lacipirellulaceae bacterium]